MVLRLYLRIWFQRFCFHYRLASFKSYTRTKSICKYIRKQDEIYKVSEEILNEIEIKEKIRLIGLSASNFTENKNRQLTFLIKKFSLRNQSDGSVVSFYILGIDDILLSMKDEVL